MVEGNGKWLLMLHQIPPKPAYFRARVLRRLNQLGALAIKNSAYLMPANNETLEDLQWVRRDIETEGGEAWLFRADLIAGLTEAAIIGAFHALREPDYRELLDAGHQLVDRLRAGAETSQAESRSTGDYQQELRRLKRRFTETRQIDFFGAPGNQEVEALINMIENSLNSSSKRSGKQLSIDDLKGRIWVTRQGIKIDRIASAWLIRRFIDPTARFQFIDPDNYQHRESEIRFDMFEGEFTHEQDRCTFEMLLQRIESSDPALTAIAEVIHDIDLKDRKFQRAEAAGIAPVIDGIALRHSDDLKRLDEGSMVFDALYERFCEDLKATTKLTKSTKKK